MTKLLPRFAVPAVLVSLFAVNAFAAPGINLAWTECLPDPTSLTDMTSTCVSNTGSAGTMVASFIPPAGIVAYIGMNAVVDITAAGGAMPSWWDMGTGGCRVGRASSSSDFTGATQTCTDFFAGNGSGTGNYATQIDTSNGHNTTATAPLTNHARIREIWGVADASAAALNPSTEYYAFKVTINRALSSGGGSCAGCATAMCIVLNQMNLAELAPAPPEGTPLTTTPGGVAPPMITWQGGSGADCNSVPVKNKTWGQIKSLYH